MTLCQIKVKVHQQDLTLYSNEYAKHMQMGEHVEFGDIHPKKFWNLRLQILTPKTPSAAIHCMIVKPHI